MVLNPLSNNSDARNPSNKYILLSRGSLTKKKETPLDEYLNTNPEAIQKSFYCYIVSCMNDESIRGYMDGFRNLLVQHYIDNQTEELPDEIKDDEVTMDFRKQEIDKHAQKLSNQVIEDLFLLMNHNDKIEV